MIFFTLKRHLSFSLSGLLLILLLVVGSVSLAVVSPAQTAFSRANLASRWQGIGPGGPGIHHQQNNQVLQGVNNGGGNATFVGAGQGNSGNLGVNKGLNQVNSANGG